MPKKMYEMASHLYAGIQGSWQTAWERKEERSDDERSDEDVFRGRSWESKPKQREEPRTVISSVCERRGGGDEEQRSLQVGLIYM